MLDRDQTRSENGLGGDIDPARTKWAAPIVFAPKQSGWLTTLMCQLPKGKCFYEAKRIPDTTNGQIYRFFSRSRSLLYVGCKHCVLTVPDQKRRSRQNGLYLTRRIDLIFAHTFSITECLKHVTTNDACCTMSSEIAVCIRLS